MHLLNLFCSCSEAEPTATAPAPTCGRSWKKIPNEVEVDLQGVWARNQNEIWAVGANGIILKCDPNACVVTQSDHGNMLERVRGTEAEIYASGWAVRLDTQSYETRLYEENDEQWTRTDPGFPGQVFDFWATSEARYAAGSLIGSGRVWVERNNKWSALENPFLVAYATWGTSADDMYFAGSTRTGEASLHRLVDSRFELINESKRNTLKAVFGLGGRVFVGGGTENGNSLIARVSNATLDEETVEDIGEVRAIFGTNIGDLWAIGTNGKVARRGAAGWRIVEVDTALHAHSGFSLDSSHTYVVGNKGAVMRYDCEPAPPPVEAPSCKWHDVLRVASQFSGIWRSKGGRVYLAATDGISVLEDERARTLWTKGRMRLEAVSGVDNEVFAVGGEGRTPPPTALVVRCIDDVCEQMQTPFAGTLYGVHALAPNAVFAVGIDGQSCSRILRFDGREWSAFEGLGCILLRGIWGAAPDDVWAAGSVANVGATDSGRILHFDGDSWSIAVERAPMNLWAMTGRNSNDVYAVGIDETAPFDGRSYGSLLHWNGEEWAEILNESARGFTSATVAADGALWLGAYRWRPLERNSRPEIVRLHNGDEGVSRPCETDVGRITGLSIDPDGMSWAIGSEGSLMSFGRTTSN